METASVIEKTGARDTNQSAMIAVRSSSITTPISRSMRAKRSAATSNQMSRRNNMGPR